MKKLLERDYNQFADDIASLLKVARRQTVRSVNAIIEGDLLGIRAKDCRI